MLLLRCAATNESEAVQQQAVLFVATNGHVRCVCVCVCACTVQVGEAVTAEGLEGYRPVSATQMKKHKVFDSVAPDLKTDAHGVATWQGRRLMTSAGPCTAALFHAAIH